MSEGTDRERVVGPTIEVLEETKKGIPRPSFSRLLRSALKVVSLPIGSRQGTTVRIKVMYGSAKFNHQESQCEGTAFLADVLSALSEELPRERLEQIQINRLRRLHQQMGLPDELFEQRNRNNLNELRLRSKEELLRCGVPPLFEDHQDRIYRPDK